MSISKLPRGRRGGVDFYCYIVYTLFVSVFSGGSLKCKARAFSR